MEIKKVIKNLETLKKDAVDTAKFYPAYQKFIETLDIAIEVLKEKELLGAGTPKELNLINISRKL